MIRDYMVVQERKAEKLQTTVKLLIEEGWQPLGGVTYAQEDTDDWLLQPMVKSDIEVMGRTDLRQDDVLVVTIEHQITKEMAHDIRAQVENLFPGNKVIVLVGGMTLSAMG